MDPLLQGDDDCSKRHLIRNPCKVAREPELHSRENGPSRAIARNPFVSITQKADPLLQGGMTTLCGDTLKARPLTCLLKNQKFAGRSKMVRCKEAKKSRTRSVLRRCVVWILSLTQQLAVFQWPVTGCPCRSFCTPRVCCAKCAQKFPVTPMPWSCSRRSCPDS